MKKTILIFFLLLLSNLLYSQLFVEQEQIPKFIFGFHSSGQIENINYNNTYLYLIETEPHISFYPIKHLGFGFMFNYMYTKSNFVYYPSFYSYGIFVRYYFGFQINKLILDRFSFFMEIDYNRANYQVIEKGVYPTVYDKANQSIINIPIGYQFRIWKGLFFETCFEYSMYVNGIQQINPRIGIEYHFNKTKK